MSWPQRNYVWQQPIKGTRGGRNFVFSLQAAQLPRSKNCGVCPPSPSAEHLDMALFPSPLRNARAFSAQLPGPGGPDPPRLAVPAERGGTSPGGGPGPALPEAAEAGEGGAGWSSTPAVRWRCGAAARRQGTGSPRAACARRQRGHPRAVPETSGNSRAEVTPRGRSFLFAAEGSRRRWCGRRLLAGRAAAALRRHRRGWVRAARPPRDGPRLVRPRKGDGGGSDRRGRRFLGRASVLSNSVAGNGASRRGLARRRHAARWRTGGAASPGGGWRAACRGGFVPALGEVRGGFVRGAEGSGAVGGALRRCGTEPREPPPRAAAALGLSRNSERRRSVWGPRAVLSRIGFVSCLSQAEKA